MWIAGYLTHQPGWTAPGAVAFGLQALCVLGAGWVAGCLTGSVRAAFAGGLVCGAVNLLILGSLARQLAADNMMAYAALWAPASILATAGGMALGALFAGRPAGQPVAANWRGGLLGVLVALTLVLIWIGGTVTGVEAGMAVPDWPGTFGFNMFFYPLAKMTGGIFFEHAHRLFGALVGLTTMVMMVHTFVADRRGWTRVAAVVAFIVVCTQGTLGGLRVTENNLQLAMLHGVLAQIFFALTVLLWAASTRGWSTIVSRTDPRAGFERGFALATLLMVLVQLLLGVLLRHAAWGLHVHITGAVMTLGLAAHLGMRLWGRYADVAPLHRLGLALLIAVCAQFALGFGAWIAVTFEKSGDLAYRVQAIVTTLHQTLGAAVLALTVALGAWHLRAVRPAGVTEQLPAGGEEFAAS